MKFIQNATFLWIILILSFSVYGQQKTANPNISFIGDFQGQYNSGKEKKIDLFLNEVEIAAYSDIDPYARADFFFSYGREGDSPDLRATLEEGYITSLGLPAGLQLKAGRFRSAFGKINLIHPHARNYIDNPNVLENFFGESLSDEGLSINWLIPNPFDFYQDITLEITRGPSGNNSFAASDKSKLMYVGHLKDYWDLSDNSTLELGFSGASGPNDSSLTTQMAGVDFTYKWKPLQFNTYKSFVFQTELLLSKHKITKSKNIRSFGGYAFASYQIAKRWFLSSRFDYSNLPLDNKWIERGFSGIIGWQATEFQKLELQVKRTTSNNFDAYNQVMIRSIFVIGAHGAHQY